MRIINVNAGRHMGTHDQWLQQFETELQITPVNDGYKTTFLVNSQDNILAPAIGKAKLVKQFKKRNFPEVTTETKILSNGRYGFAVKHPAQMSNLPSDIAELIKLAIDTVSPETAYNQFCDELEKAISLTFAGQEYTGREIMTKEKYILRNVVQSFANQLYVKRVYLKK